MPEYETLPTLKLGGCTESRAETNLENSQVTTQRKKMSSCRILS